jgi:hypothetical protein
MNVPQEGRAEPAELAASSLCLVNLGVSTRLLNYVGEVALSTDGFRREALPLKDGRITRFL